MNVMRIRSLLVLGIAGAAFAAAACEATGTQVIAGLNNGGQAAGAGGGITIQPASISISVGGSAQLTSNASNDSTLLVWASSNTNVAQVSSTGLVTGITPGTATVTVHTTTDSTHRASASITVTSQ